MRAISRAYHRRIGMRRIFRHHPVLVRRDLAIKSDTERLAFQTERRGARPRRHVNLARLQHNARLRELVPPDHLRLDLVEAFESAGDVERIDLLLWNSVGDEGHFEGIPSPHRHAAHFSAPPSSRATRSRHQKRYRAARFPPSRRSSDLTASC